MATTYHIYVVCPVRLGISKEATEYVKKLEERGYKVYYPPRDAPQDDDTGMNIIISEREAIVNCREVHVFYDARSQGIHFDLGMAFMLNKPIKFIEILVSKDKNYPSHGEKTYVRALEQYRQEHKS